MRAARFFRWTAGLVISTLSSVGWCHRIDDALASATREQRPLLVLGSSPWCDPCQRLHATIAADPTIQRLLRHCEFVPLDAQSQEFSAFAARFPVDARRIPMIYVVLPDGSLLYGQSGLLEGEQLAMLLNEAMRRARPVVPAAPVNSPTLATGEQVLATAREYARRGELLRALKTVAPLADRKDDTEQAAKARGYRQRLVVAVQQWLQDLDNQITSGNSIHGAVYRVADIHLASRQCRQIHATTHNLLRRYQSQPRTALAVRQAKALLRARYFERQELPERAVSEFERVVTLDPASPAAEFARHRMGAMRDQRSPQAGG